MKYLISSANVPATFTVGGKFISDEPWKHETLQNEDYELIICLAGILYLNVGEKQLTIHPKEMVLIPNNTKIEGRRQSPSVTFIWLHFIPEKKATFSKVPGDELKSLLTDKQTRKFAIPSYFKFDDVDHLIIATHQLLNVMPPGEYKFEAQNALLTYILLTISSEFFRTIEKRKVTPNEYRISKIKNWICENMTSDLTVKTVSDHFSLSHQYLDRIFKQQEGITVIQFINLQKIRVAEFLLLESSLTVKEIGGYSYFKNEKQYFYQFKKIAGTTPLKFRNTFGPMHTNNPQIDPQLPMPRRARKIIESKRKDD